MRNSYFFICFALVAFLFTNCGNNKGGGQETSSTLRPVMKGGQASVVDDLSARNIVQIAASSEDHTTLVAAVQAAGMADVLAIQAH